MTADEKTTRSPALTARKRYMGLDLGQKTIGLATSDRSALIATPLHTIKRTKLTKDCVVLKGLIDEHQITDLVIGLPLHMDGTHGARCQSVKTFARTITAHGIDLPVHFQDERMSSQAVERTMLDADISRQKRAVHVDKLAAAYILQGFLDGLADNR